MKPNFHSPIVMFCDAGEVQWYCNGIQCTTALNYNWNEPSVPLLLLVTIYVICWLSPSCIMGCNVHLNFTYSWYTFVSVTQENSTAFIISNFLKSCQHVIVATTAIPLYLLCQMYHLNGSLSKEFRWNKFTVLLSFI